MIVNSPEQVSTSPLRCPDTAPRTEASKYYPDLPDNLSIAQQWIGKIFDTTDNVGKYTITLTKAEGEGGLPLNSELKGTIVLRENGDLLFGNNKMSEIQRISLEKKSIIVNGEPKLKTVYYFFTKSGSKYMLKDWKLN